MRGFSLVILLQTRFMNMDIPLVVAHAQLFTWSWRDKVGTNWVPSARVVRWEVFAVKFSRPFHFQVIKKGSFAVLSGLRGTEEKGEKTIKNRQVRMMKDIELSIKSTQSILHNLKCLVNFIDNEAYHRKHDTKAKDRKIGVEQHLDTF